MMSKLINKSLAESFEYMHISYDIITYYATAGILIHNNTMLIIA